MSLSAPVACPLSPKTTSVPLAHTAAPAPHTPPLPLPQANRLTYSLPLALAPSTPPGRCSPCRTGRTWAAAWRHRSRGSRWRRGGVGRLPGAWTGVGVSRIPGFSIAPCCFPCHAARAKQLSPCLTFESMASLSHGTPVSPHAGATLTAMRTQASPAQLHGYRKGGASR